MKKSLVFALALMLVLAFASSAFAAQAIGGTPSATNPAGYLSTTATGLDYAGTAPTGSAFSRVYQSSKFTVDGYTYYPYEIYLPNEENPASYRIHSNYAKNTDACASCHATHTAVGDSLLQWYTVYETCMACHDGTLGNATYNVEEGKIGNTASTAFGGMFGVGTESSLSNHNVTGSMDIAAAPGGSTAEEVVGGKSRWTVEFGCQSCHTPHGNGGNARILHPDANLTATKAASLVQTGYTISVEGRVYAEAVPTNASTPLYILKGYPYSYSILDGATPVAATIDNSLGYSVVTGFGVGDRVYGIPALQVKMNISGYLTAGENVEHVSGMNAYCGACHTDYNTEGTFFPSDTLSGTYTQAHRHKVGSSVYLVTGNQAGYGNSVADLEASGLKFESNNLECLTCHVAHGVSADYWAETLNGVTFSADGTAWDADPADAMYTELAGSSALKRMPNMGTCEACHQKGDSAQGYNVNAGFDPDNNPSGDPDILNAGMPNTYIYSANTFAPNATDIPATDLGWVGSAKCLGCHEEYVEGWSETGHATSGHNATGLYSGGCAGCHNPGANLNWNNPIFQDDATNTKSLDDAITCESCHGTGKNHIAAPSAKNIFNPGTTDILRQTIECGRCHDMYANKFANATGSAPLGTVLGAIYEVSGSGSFINNKVTGNVYTTQAMYNAAKAGTWSPGFRVAQDNPTQFANASQLATVSTHFGGAWGYADSKHFLGTNNDIKNPNGVVSCNTCHDMHSDKHAGALKFSYEQVCASCHDSSANLAFAAAMPMNAWGRHQLELRDFAHSFNFGNAKTAAEITSATLATVNLESALADGKTDPQTTFRDQYLKAGASQSAAEKHDSLFAGASGSGRGGGVGTKLSIFNGATQLYNSYAGTYELEVVDNAGQPGVAQEGVDYVWEEEVGAVEFPNTGATYDTGLLCGTYTITWTSAVDPTVTQSATFTVAP